MEHAKTPEVLDRAGTTASIACAVHCTALPLILMALPALVLAWLDSAWVDWTMILIAAVVAIQAHRGGIALHKRCRPVGVTVAGILAIMTGICLLKGSATTHCLRASGPRWLRVDIG